MAYHIKNFFDYCRNLIKKININLYKCLFFIIGIFFGSLIFIVWLLIYIGPYTTMKVKHDLAKNPVDIIVSLTTTPYRINKIKQVLDSVARQSIQPTRIYVNIPLVFKRDNSEYVIPDWLKKYPNIIINRTKDYGPATKLIATLEKEHNPEAIIITIDDDRIYHKHVIRDLAKQYLPNTYKVNYKFNAAITGAGFYMLSDIDKLYLNEMLVEDRPSVIIIGTYGVAYKRKFFKNDIFSLFDDLPMVCFLSDDLMISAYLLVNHTTIVKISGVSYNQVAIREFFTLTDSHNTADALIKGANGLIFGSNEIDYGNCLNDLPNYGKSNYQAAIYKRSRISYSIYHEEIDRHCIRKWIYCTLRKTLNFSSYFKRFVATYIY